MPLNDVENKENEYRARKRQNMSDFRLREKQKKVELEEHVRSLELQVECLQQQNSNLARENEVLQMKIDAQWVI